MRVVVQRVAHARVSIGRESHSEIGRGLLVLLGVAVDDTAEDADYLVKKVSQLRIFDDDEGVMNRSIQEIGGDILVVSQFTLLASTKKGNRPSYIRAAREEQSRPLYELFVARLCAAVGRAVATGVFGADMMVSLANDGPVTVILDSKRRDF